jgi:hypothetical protein
VPELPQLLFPNKDQSMPQFGLDNLVVETHCGAWRLQHQDTLTTAGERSWAENASWEQASFCLCKRPRDTTHMDDKLLVQLLPYVDSK